MKHTEEHNLLTLMEKCGQFLYQRRGGKRGQGRILKILSAEGEMTQKELQQRLGIQSGSMSEIVLKLEGNGLVSRERDEADKRKIRLKITEEGKYFFEEKHKARIEREKKLFNVLTEEEQEVLKVLLTKLAEDWESNFEKAPFEHAKEHHKKHID